MRKIILVLTVLISGFISKAQITTTVNPTIAQIQQVLQGNGVTITGLTKTCPTGASALFSGGASVFPPLSSGILLTTGSASNINGANSQVLSTNNVAPGSALGDNLAGATTYDACYLKFLITPSCNTLNVSYVFVSDEYVDWEYLGINDVFGFVIDGPNPSGPAYSQHNLATVPGTSNPVTIRNVNSTSNSASYATYPTLKYNGGTTVLTASCVVTPCQTYTMTIGVWDASDSLFDSGVFLDVNGLSCLGSPTLVATASPSVVCSNQTVSLSVAGGLPSGTYTWTAPPSGGLVGTNGSNVTANPSATTTYTVLYSDVNSCPGSQLTKYVTVNIAGSLTVTPSSTITCASGPAVTLSASGASSYTWSPAAGISSPNSGTVTALPSASTIYTVSGTIATCVGTNTVQVTIDPCIPPTAHFTTSTQDSICVGGCVTFSNTSSGSPTNYTWYFPGGTPSTSTAQNPQVCYNAAGDYPVSLVVSNTYGSDSLGYLNYIDVAITPTVIAYGDTTINYSQSAHISATGGITYNWSPAYALSCSSCATAIASPTMSTMYVVTGYSSPYCSSSDTIHVIVDFVCGDLFVANAFSPNNDGLNDELHIKGFCVSSFIMQIYDRWGEKVFETRDKTTGWDGTYKGKPLATGVFAYRVDGITIEGKTFSMKGNVTLIR